MTRSSQSKDTDVAKRTDSICSSIAGRLRAEAQQLSAAFNANGAAGVRWCVVDDLLPIETLTDAYNALPLLDDMVRRRSIMERKYVSAQIDRLGQPLQDLVMVLNSRAIVDCVARIMTRPNLESDGQFYNGGVTVMLPGDFMCPHLDNSRDFARKRRRDVVLLYYLTTHWRDGYGGALEIWPKGPRSVSQLVPFRPNRLVIMETNDVSWHSVQRVRGPVPRANLVTYYYSPVAASDRSTRLTRFSSWPGQPARGMALAADFYLRSLAAKAVGGRLRMNRHVFRPAPQEDEPED